MRVLVIGGSVFVGRAVVDEALALGAEVTVLNRGRSGPPPPDGVTALRGDRTVPADLEQLRGARFDVVVDTCGYVPVDVATSADLLADSVGHYAFVSSVNAFPGWPTEPDYRAGGVHDGDPDATRDDVPPDLDPSGAYGWLKVGCERAVVRAFGSDRCSVLRAGLIAGPHDTGTGRLPWWIARIARGGEVLVPGHPDDPVALIDVRDLARFALAAVPGTYEVTGPSGRDNWSGLTAACRDATGSDATFTWVGSDWLADQGVAPWSELPLWLPASVGRSTWAHDPSAAVTAGLDPRPLAATVADTWEWQRTLTDPAPTAAVGLEPECERGLLAAWQAAGA